MSNSTTTTYYPTNYPTSSSTSAATGTLPSDRQVLRGFLQEHEAILVRENVSIISNGRHHIFTDRREINEAILADRPFHALRSSLKVLKVLSRTKRSAGWWEVQSLALLAADGPPDTFAQGLDFDTLGISWIAMNYFGPPLSAFLARQGAFWASAPELFVWARLKDTISALAFLHCNVKANRQGLCVPSSPRTSISINLGMENLYLSTSKFDEHGWPRLVVANLGKIECKPHDVDLVEWEPAANDLEVTASVFHMLAHGRKYQNKQNAATRTFCNCLTTKTVQNTSFLRSTTSPPSTHLRDTLDRFCYTGTLRVTSAGILADMNATDLRTAGISQEIEDYWQTHVDFCADIQLFLRKHSVTNQELRAVVPAVSQMQGHAGDFFEGGAEWGHEVPGVDMQDGRRK